MTNLKFKLETAQYLSFHCRQRKTCSSARQSIISALMGREEDKDDNTFFCENIINRVLSFKRGHCSLILGRGRKLSTITLDFCRKWGTQNAPAVQTKEFDSPACLPIPSARRNLTVPPILTLLCRSWIMPHTGPQAACKQHLAKCPSFPVSRKVGKVWAKASHQQCQDACSPCCD